MKVRIDYRIDPQTSQAKLGKFLGEGQLSHKMTVIVANAEVLAERTIFYFNSAKFDTKKNSAAYLFSTNAPSRWRDKFAERAVEIFYNEALKRVLDNPEQHWNSERFIVEIDMKELEEVFKEADSINDEMRAWKERNEKIDELKRRGFKVVAGPAWYNDYDNREITIEHPVLGRIEGKTEELYEKYALMDEKEFELLILRKENEQLRTKLASCKKELEDLREQLESDDDDGEDD